jgi:hypothetical protein
MALTKETKFKGVTIPDAYIRVNNFSGSKDSIAFNVGFYGNADENGEREMFDQKAYQCAYNLNGSNAVKQAYDHLKTLPEFTGALES